jgi:hypothetical protein
MCGTPKLSRRPFLLTKPLRRRSLKRPTLEPSSKIGKSRENYLKGKLSTIDLLVKVACFASKITFPLKKKLILI